MHCLLVTEIFIRMVDALISPVAEEFIKNSWVYIEQNRIILQLTKRCSNILSCIIFIWVTVHINRSM